MSETPTAETGAPTCRACYAATLTPDERDRFNSERVTSCVYLCPKHQCAIDAALARLDRASVLIERPRVIPPGESHRP